MIHENYSRTLLACLSTNHPQSSRHACPGAHAQRGGAMTPAVSLLDAALAYAARGWHVFPCHTPTAQGCSCRRTACNRIGKHPRWYDDTKHGLKDATTNEATIRRWWRRWPTANIAIATGAVSGLVILDNDSYKGGDNSLRELEQRYHPLPETALS